MNDTEPKDDVTTKPEKTIISDDMLIIVPVRNLVLFPGTVVPVAINRERSLAAAQEAVRAERKVGFVLQHDPDLASPTGSDLYKVGTVASIVRYVTGQDARITSSYRVSVASVCSIGRTVCPSWSRASNT